MCGECDVVCGFGCGDVVLCGVVEIDCVVGFVCEVVVGDEVVDYLVV